MKTLSVFLASSIVEFKSDRLLIGDYVRRLNDDLFPRGIYVNLVVCEEISNALHYARKQSEYNDRIKECDLFYILIGRRAGGYTVEEYNTASEAFSKNGYPEIRCFLRSSEEPDESVGQLKERIISDGHPVKDFPDAASLIDDLDEQIRSAVAGMGDDENVQENTTEHISILLAMPEHELLDEQVELSDFVRCLNDEYYPRGIYFDLTTFGELQEKAERAGDQDFFYIVFRTEGDDDIVRSFDVAKDRFLRSGNPRIYTFFQTLPSGAAPSEGVRAFMDKLDKELGHFYSVFPNIDSLKLNMLIEVTRFKILSEAVSVNDGSAYLNGKEFMELGNVPAFSRNGRLKEIRQELPGLLKLRTELQAGYDENDPDEEVRNRLSETAEKINALNKELNELENSILEMFSAVAERNSSGRPITWREKEASRYLDEGNYDAALALLRDSSREEELKYAISMKNSGADAVTGYINEELLRIKTLKATGINKSTLPEIYECYERCMKIAKEQKLDPGFLSEYLTFLKDQHDYKSLIRNGEWLIKYHELLGIDKAAAAQCYSDLGVGYRYSGRFTDAVSATERSIEIREELAQTDPGKYNPFIARSYGNLSNIYAALNDNKTAADLMTKALGLFKKTAEYDQSYEQDVAKAYNDLANSYARMKQYHDARALYRESAAILEKLYAEDPARNADELGRCYHNLALCLKYLHDYRKAEEICEKAISIRNGRAWENPAACEESLAQSYELLANIYSDGNNRRYTEADTYHFKALHIFERLASEFPEIYEKNLANILNDIGLNCYKIEKYPEAEEYYKKALGILERLASGGDSRAYEPGIAMIRHNLARVYDVTERYEEAETMYISAAATREKLSEDDFRSNGLAYISSCKNLAGLYRKIGEYTDAETYYLKVTEAYEQLCVKEPDVYYSDLASNYNNLGLVCMNQKKDAESEEYYRKSLNLYEYLAGRDHKRYDPNLALEYNNLALACHINKKYEEAEDSFRKAITIRERLAEDYPEKYNGPLASSYEGLARLYTVTGRPDEAEEYRNKANSLKTPKNSEEDQNNIQEN